LSLPLINQRRIGYRDPVASFRSTSPPWSPERRLGSDKALPSSGALGVSAELMRSWGMFSLSVLVTDGLRPPLQVDERKREGASCVLANLDFALEERLDVLGIQVAEVETDAGSALRGGVDLRGDGADGGNGVVLHRTDREMSGED
jgi:hypothetical protein